MSGELRLDFPACLAADFPSEAPVAIRTVDRVLAAIHGSTFAPLEERSPGLRGSDFVDYLRCSQARMVRAANAVRRHGAGSGRVLDYGAYFGNFALMFADLGFAVDAVDAYATYAPSLDPALDLLRSNGVSIHDFGAVGRDLHALPEGSYDVVLCMGVVEHIPHTPRTLLEPLARVLKPGGLLIMDTPNLAQLSNRQKLAKGESVMTPLPIQYHASIPFEGHHREYTVGEMVWMTQELGHQVLSVELFNYSVYGHQALAGRDVANHWRTVATPDMRELVLVTSRKPRIGESRAVVEDWRSVFAETEQYWLARRPPSSASGSDTSIVDDELLLVSLQEGIALRDRMLADLEADRVAAVELRDRELSALRDRVNEWQRRFAATESERLKRWLRRWRLLRSPREGD